MKKAYRVLFILLSVATGGLFLYSAYTKLFPIQAFEYTIVEIVHIPLIVASIATRFFIGLEAGLGALLVLHLFGKNKWPLKAAFILLIVFTVYLIWLWITAGNDVNCGCFGDAIWMSPSVSLVKNVLLLAIIALLIRYHNGFTYK
ncbi:MAG: MauE/DoxX family redox-associated membrane protein, partial [Bacteroidia bacterium]